LTDTERRDLIRATVGYRLPMDDGSGNVDPATDSADAYNEWLKATARKGVDADGLAVFGALYGFGRDTLTTVDGNYLDSGDPFETGGDPNVDGTSPQRFYDGTNLLDDEDDESETVDTENGYALYDTTGNVREWMQDWYADGDPSARAVRGGSWEDPVDAVALTNFARVAVPPHVADDQTGFRVVRGTGHVAEISVTDNINGDTHRRAVILDLREPLTLEPRIGLEAAGTYCQGLGDVATLTYTLHNESTAEMSWEVVLEPDVEWLDLPEVVTGTITGDDDAANDVEIVVSTNLFPNLLPPGEYTTDLRVTNTLTDESHTRSFSLTIEQPIVVMELSGGAEAALEMFWEADVEGLPSFAYALSLCTDCQVNCDLDYEVMAVDDWLSVGPEEELTGTLPDPPGSVFFQASANETASALAVGEYVGTVAFAFVDPNNDVTPDPIERTIKLTVIDPIVVSPTSPWNPAAGGGLEPPPAPQTFLLTNMHATKDIGVVISVDVDWIDVDLPNQTVPPGAEQSVILSINDNGQALTHGEYEATVTFADLTTGEDQTRDVVLTITEELTVTPADDFIASGQAGGPIGPIFKPYKLTNNAGEGGEPIEWSVSVDPWPAWISVIADGVPLSPGETRSLPDGASVFAFVTIDVAQTMEVADGTHESQLVFTTVGVEESTGRTITLTLVTPQFTVNDQAVPVDAVQTDGPTHTFKMGTHHTTNEEFTVFLNDALANPDNERGQYMFFDTKTGDVYVNDDVVGESGTDLGELSALMFAAEAGGHIVFDGAAYEVAGGFEQHPAAGISWYGALKYCNWLTLDQGMLPGERCYSEDTDANLAGWHPAVVTTEEWAQGDLDDAQRFDLVVNFRGYRLPMDDGSNNENPTVDTPDVYNEWFKAASAKLGDEGEIVFGTLYGFGRDEITGADANFFESGDPFEPGPTPVGFYDGTLYNPGGGGTIGDGSEFQTVADENAFGLRDMTGNVYQWMQGRFADDFGFRALRGGSWENVPGDQFSHLLVDRRALGQPGFSHQTIGLRVVQSLATPNGDVDADGDIDLFDTGAIIACQTGPDGGGVSLDCGVFDFDVDDDVDLRDVGTLMNAFTGSL
ncbi:MAG: SUMF1/EgtB/PvdO family nonheme iron enzyme, partial [Planctomycetes bacterium]|nr:SUMF1/EgtB/PvdO family nonheme iron enzyme [Planctomycetota bacterium]